MPNHLWREGQLIGNTTSPHPEGKGTLGAIIRVAGDNRGFLSPGEVTQLEHNANFKRQIGKLGGYSVAIMRGEYDYNNRPENRWALAYLVLNKAIMPQHKVPFAQAFLANLAVPEYFSETCGDLVIDVTGVASNVAAWRELGARPKVTSRKVPIGEDEGGNMILRRVETRGCGWTLPEGNDTELALDRRGNVFGVILARRVLHSDAQDLREERKRSLQKLQAEAERARRAAEAAQQSADASPYLFEPIRCSAVNSVEFCETLRQEVSSGSNK